jgi:hypothetical protein
MHKQPWNLDFLHEEIEIGIAGLDRHVKANPPYITLLGLIRELDAQITIPYHDDNSANPPLSRLYKFGWQTLFRESYKLFDMKPRKMLFPSSEEHITDAKKLLSFAGRVGVCRQYLDYLRYRMIKVAEVIGRHVRFEPGHEYFGIERFDMEYRMLVAEHIIGEIIKERESQQPKKFEVIQPLMKQTVANPISQFMSYDAPEQVWDFFEQQGQYRLLALQEHDNFGSDDLFGGVPYRTYVDSVEYLMGVALMHMNYAMAARESYPQILLENLLPYLRPESSFIEELAHEVGITVEQAHQVLECLTLDRSNYEGYTDFTAAAPPPFIRMSKGYLLRSVAGCLNNPFQLLNYELKRRYKGDYDKANDNKSKNSKEVRFRKELFHLFPQEHIIKINRGVKLNTLLGDTDVDAVLYDKIAGTVALIQLKWPDGYGDSMRRRESVMTNYYDKANVWVDKVYSWVEEADSKKVFDRLQIKATKAEHENFKGIYILVLNRNTAHFTSGEPSEKAAWGSWAQLVATLGTGLKHMPDNPLGAAYSCLRYFDPKRRADRGDVPRVAPFDMEIGASRLTML